MTRNRVFVKNPVSMIQILKDEGFNDGKENEWK